MREQAWANRVDDTTHCETQLVDQTLSQHGLGTGDAAVHAHVAPVRALSSATTSVSGPWIGSALAHADDNAVEVSTYFFTLLMKSANGWSVDVGQ